MISQQSRTSTYTEEWLQTKTVMLKYTTGIEIDLTKTEKYYSIDKHKIIFTPV